MANSQVAGTRRRFLPRTVGERLDEERIGRIYRARQLVRVRLRRWGIVAIVIAPTALSALYYGFIATPRYVSEAQFIVRGLQGIGQGGGLRGLLQAVGVSISDDDSNAVQDYLVSRDAVAALEKALPLRDIYQRSDADLLSRFPRPFFGDSFEQLYKYYLNRVDVIVDTDTSIITLQAEAFRPENAQAIAIQLLAQAESLVNALNDRLEADTVRSAETAVAEATRTVLTAQMDITRFRNLEIVVDPSKNALAQLDTITQLSLEIDQVLAKIVESGKTAPSSPLLATLKAQADGLASQIAVEEKGLAGTDQGIADKVSNFEQLTLLRSLADAALTAATASLESARAQARRQRVFVDEIVAPNLPDEALISDRLRAVATVFCVSFAALAVFWLISVGVKEHGN